MGIYLGMDEKDKVKALLDKGCTNVSLIVELSSCMESFKPDDKLLVCVVDNGAWQSAAICFNEAEFNRFNYAGDPRPKTWFLVSEEVARSYAEDLELYDRLFAEESKK